MWNEVDDHGLNPIVFNLPALTVKQTRHPLIFGGCLGFSLIMGPFQLNISLPGDLPADKKGLILKKEKKSILLTCSKLSVVFIY
jgi:hypothetical protein